ncbi:MAG TPA: histidine kinase [Vicinamibacterales bacterium]|nr:histidine kinase [Vicinamibacterales bacterium]
MKKATRRRANSLRESFTFTDSLTHLTVHPEYPPRVRVEWMTATARVVIAGGAFLAAVIGPSTASAYWILNTALGWYLLYSLLVLGLVWTPVRFTKGWGPAVHVFDLIAFSLFTFFNDGATSPFFLYFTFLVICGTLRWEIRGALWTAIAAIVVSGTMSVVAYTVLHFRTVAPNTFLIRSVHLAVVAVLLGYLGAYQRRILREIRRVVSWPRKIPRNPRDLVREILIESAEILEAPRVLLVWEESGEGDLNLAWWSGAEVLWTREPGSTYEPTVAPGLEDKSFQALDANREGRVVQWHGGSFLQRQCRPVHTALQARFDMHALQSWALEGELVRGRLFSLDKRTMALDDLILGELVARLAESRLDSLYLLDQLRESAALKERLRVARDLHDSLLQSVAGTALQLLAARRLFDRDPEAAIKRLDDVQNQLEHGEVEMRSFIRRLRPSSTAPSGSSLPVSAPFASSGSSVPSGLLTFSTSTTKSLSPTVMNRVALGDRLEELRERVERQWEVKVRIRLRVTDADWPESQVDEVYRIAQEAVLNAARHAEASVIRLDLSATYGSLQLEIADDGHGFPFRGTYDLAALNEMDRGPLTLKERVAELQGDLRLRSLETGTELLIRLPIAHATTH